MGPRKERKKVKEGKDQALCLEGDHLEDLGEVQELATALQSRAGKP